MTKDNKIELSDFVKILDELADSFRIARLEDRCAVAYFRTLQNIPEYKLRQQADTILRYDTYFPSIARLYEADKIDRVSL